MKHVLYAGLVMLCVARPASAQTSQGVTSIDFVKAKEGKQAEVLAFFQNNWKAYREVALRQGHITSYQLLTGTPDAKGDFDIMLITSYPDSAAYARREEHFGKIMKEVAAGRPKPSGPKPREMFEIRFDKIMQAVAAECSTPSK